MISSNNLYKRWLEQQERREFEKMHGVTMHGGIPVHEFKTLGMSELPAPTPNQKLYRGMN
jgi:hypothetical protein